MYRAILLAFALLGLALPVSANIEQVEQNQQTKNQIKKEKQKMEDRPRILGGARSGNLELEKQRDEEKMRHDLEKQKQLYENEENYRKGL